MLRPCLEVGFESENHQFFDETRRLFAEHTLRYGQKKQRRIIKKMIFAAQSLTSKHGLRILIAVFLFFCLSSCQKREGLNKFFLTLKNKIPQQELDRFKEISRDSVPDEFARFSVEYQEAFKEEFPTKEDIKDLELLLIGDNDRDKLFFIFYRFHDWINGKEHSVEEYKQIIKNYHVVKIERELNDEIRQKEKLLEVILKNKNHWQVGDTLALTFPFDKEHFGKVITERIFPYNMEVYEFEDKLKMKGILLATELDSFELVYKLRIIEVSEDSVFLYSTEQYAKVDEIFELPLKKYGRLIE